MIKSGFKETIVSMLGLMPPILGSRQASLGYLQKSVIAITRSFNPNSKRVSVIAGEVEMIRLAKLTFVLLAQRRDDDANREVTNKITWTILVFKNV